MAWQHVDMESALRRLADRKIEAAIEEGKFDNLKGAGQPLDLEPMPANEAARLNWWALRIFKQNDVAPHEVTYRKQIDAVLEQIHGLADERLLPPLVTRYNQLVRLVNTMGTTALQASVVMLDLDAERHRLRGRVARG